MKKRLQEPKRAAILILSLLNMMDMVVEANSLSLATIKDLPVHTFLIALINRNAQLYAKLLKWTIVY